jgi:hypothetical protein
MHGEGLWVQEVQGGEMMEKDESLLEAFKGMFAEKRIAKMQQCVLMKFETWVQTWDVTAAEMAALERYPNTELPGDAQLLLSLFKKVLRGEPASLSRAVGLLPLSLGRVQAADMGDWACGVTDD